MTDVHIRYAFQCYAMAAPKLLLCLFFFSASFSKGENTPLSHELSCSPPRNI